MAKEQANFEVDCYRGCFLRFQDIWVIDSYIPFDSAQWKSFDSSASYSLSLIGYDPRSRLFRRLERQQQLIGLNRQQLYDLLGPSDAEESTLIWTVYNLVDDKYASFELQGEKVVGYEIYHYSQWFDPD